MADIYQKKVEIDVYLSKAGHQVSQYYHINEDLTKHFDKVRVEQDSNSPFLAGKLQTGNYVFLLIAPATSNTVAKLVHGIGDTMVTNGAIQAMKAYIPVYIMPTDYREGETETTLPDGRTMRLRIRSEDAEHVDRLREMDGIEPFEYPHEIADIFHRHFPEL